VLGVLLVFVGGCSATSERTVALSRGALVTRIDVTVAVPSEWVFVDDERHAHDGRDGIVLLGEPEVSDGPQLWLSIAPCADRASCTDEPVTIDNDRRYDVAVGDDGALWQVRCRAHAGLDGELPGWLESACSGLSAAAPRVLLSDEVLARETANLAACPAGAARAEPLGFRPGAVQLRLEDGTNVALYPPVHQELVGGSLPIGTMDEQLVAGAPFAIVAHGGARATRGEVTVIARTGERICGKVDVTIGDQHLVTAFDAPLSSP